MLFWTFNGNAIPHQGRRYPVFQRLKAKNPSKLQNSRNLYVPTVYVVKTYGLAHPVYPRLRLPYPSYLKGKQNGKRIEFEAKRSLSSLSYVNCLFDLVFHVFIRTSNLFFWQLYSPLSYDGVFDL